ncbi:unnamed protein product [Rhodiola kirilowii]
MWCRVEDAPCCGVIRWHRRREPINVNTQVEDLKPVFAETEPNFVASVVNLMRVIQAWMSL